MYYVIYFIKGQEKAQKKFEILKDANFFMTELSENPECDFYRLYKEPSSSYVVATLEPKKKTK